VEWNVLHVLAVATDQQVRRNFQGHHRREERMYLRRVRRQCVGEQAIDPRPAVLVRRQADAVHEDQLGQHAARALIAVRRGDLACGLHQAAGRID
jgi:hypothetical protein